MVPEPEGERWELVDGMVVKFRSDADGWLTATIWIDDAPQRDIGRAHIDFLGPGGGSPEHTLFVQTMARLFDMLVEKRTGIPLQSRLQRPNRGHESERSSAQGGAG